MWGTDRSLLGTITLSQSGPGIDGNKGVLHIPQISCITGASQSYPGHSFGGSYPTAVGAFFSPV